jgi:hypothetical protein
MATGNAVDFGWFRYTDDGGQFWAMKVDKDWGASGQSGLQAFNAADPAWPKSQRYRPRKAILQDLVSGRRTSRVLGTAGAAAGVAGTTVSGFVRGAGGTVPYTSLGIQAERRPKTGAIISKPEPVTVP